MSLLLLLLLLHVLLLQLQISSPYLNKFRAHISYSTYLVKLHIHLRDNLLIYLKGIKLANLFVCNADWFLLLLLLLRSCLEGGHHHTLLLIVWKNMQSLLTKLAAWMTYGCPYPAMLCEGKIMRLAKSEIRCNV